jgi:hypothetical protein
MVILAATIALLFCRRRTHRDKANARKVQHTHPHSFASSLSSLSPPVSFIPSVRRGPGSSPRSCGNGPFWLGSFTTDQQSSRGASFEPATKEMMTSSSPRRSALEARSPPALPHGACEHRLPSLCPGSLNPLPLVTAPSSTALDTLSRELNSGSFPDLFEADGTAACHSNSVVAVPCVQRHSEPHSTPIDTLPPAPQEPLSSPRRHGVGRGLRQAGTAGRVGIPSLTFTPPCCHALQAGLQRIFSDSNVRVLQVIGTSNVHAVYRGVLPPTSVYKVEALPGYRCSQQFANCWYPSHPLCAWAASKPP